MTTNGTPPILRLMHVRLATPAGFLILAGGLSLSHAVCSWAGGRESTSFLSGTWSEGGRLAFGIGVAYVMTYFAFVLGVPILVLGAGLLAILQRLPRSGLVTQTEPDTSVSQQEA